MSGYVFKTIQPPRTFRLAVNSPNHARANSQSLRRAGGESLDSRCYGEYGLSTPSPVAWHQRRAPA
jgi:hypothetical protein